ncbi:hypothetical protein LJK88_19935 [Paenibacillus sp. P26]|nr:hypothetical protein LJK88_19935 [Paenibacillus sp. P26]UUZ96074.1 hypothetical protein LJK87_17910 [Paenibacillus sp. P25]
MSNERIYNHFHPDEHRFVDKAAEWVERAEQHAVKLTDFLDPRQAFILTTLAQRGTKCRCGSKADIRTRNGNGPWLRRITGCWKTRTWASA